MKNRSALNGEAAMPEDVWPAITRISSELVELKSRLGGTFHHQNANAVESGSIVRLAELIYKSRRSRNKYLSESLFGEPGWDLLLELFVAGEKGYKISVSSACIAASVPATTALRWVKHFEEAGHIIRYKDPNDNRRIWVELSNGAKGQMVAYLQSLESLLAKG